MILINLNQNSLFLITSIIFVTVTINIHPVHLERHEVQLDEKYTLGWEVNEGNGTIEIDAWGETEGYVGLGLSTKGKMDNAEMAIGGVHRENGRRYHGIYRGHHHKVKLDKKRKWTLLEARKNETHTFVKYQRPLASTVGSSSIPIKDKDIYVIWALGKSDKLKKHHGHGKYKVNLINPSDTLRNDNFLSELSNNVDFSFVV